MDHSYYSIAKRLLVLIFAWFLTLEAQAQSTTITGQVIDLSTDESLPGVNIVAKGTTVGTVTDIEGNYRITVPDSTKTLVFTSVGFVREAVDINGRTVVDISLSPDIQALQEIVVVGYGTQEKEDVTGSIVSVSSEEIEAMPTIDFNQAIQGRAAGVQVQQTSGSLEGDFDIRIRGLSSVTAGNGPLIVIDGIPLAFGGFNVNPDDIASIDILKDASATAIYGARAANGVVIITTKGGQAGKATLSFSTDLSWEQANETIDMMNSTELAELVTESYTNFGRPDLLPTELSDPNFLATSTNWQDLLLQTAFWQNYNLSLSGGDEKTRYFTSGSYTDRDGIVINTQMQRATLRANVEHDLTDRITFGTRLGGTWQSTNNSSFNQQFNAEFRTAILAKPFLAPFDATGNYSSIPSIALSSPYWGYSWNPLAQINENQREFNQNRLLGNTYLRVELVEGLTSYTNFGVDLFDQNNYIFLPAHDRGARNRAFHNVTEERNENTNYVFDQTFTYQNTFGKAHSFTGLVGLSLQQFTFENLNVVATGQTNPQLNQISNQPIISGANTSYNQNRLSSFFSRINYGFRDRYLLTATVRFDGSSRFGPDNRYGVFPSASLAWRLSEEPFMQNVALVDDLKIRGSFGLVGNQNIRDFGYLSLANTSAYAYGDATVSAVIPASIGNTNLQWESNRQWDVGLDAALFGGRLSLTADYFYRESQDLLINFPVPVSAGFTEDYATNIGSMRNTGVELGINSVNTTGNFSWTTDFNVATLDNEVLSLGVFASGEEVQFAGANLAAPFNEPVNLTTVGQPLGAFYLLEMGGIWQLNQETEAAEYGAEPGDVRFVDQDSDGDIDADDRIFAGQAQPKLYGGMTNRFAYQGWELTVFFNWQTGAKLYNTLRNYSDNLNGFINQRQELVDRWTPENPSNTIPRAHRGQSTYNSRASTRYLENADFLRLKNISLSYQLPNNLLDRIGLSTAKVTVAGMNLWTLTEYTGFNPETSSRGGSTSPGLDFTSYPLQETYTVSLNITL